jgi:hypothetical protein
MTDAPSRRLQVPDDVVFREIAGESMILHLGSGIYFGLDSVGTRAWQLIVELGTLDRISDEMAREFDADAAAIRRDLDALVAQLVDKRLLEWSS